MSLQQLESWILQHDMHGSSYLRPLSSFEAKCHQCFFTTPNFSQREHDATFSCLWTVCFCCFTHAHCMCVACVFCIQRFSNFSSAPLLPSPVFAHVCGQALERQKEYFDCIRKERDELRDELADIKGKAKSAEVGYDWPLEGWNVSTQWHSVFCLKIGQLGLHEYKPAAVLLHILPKLL